MMTKPDPLTFWNNLQLFAWGIHIEKSGRENGNEFILQECFLQNSNSKVNF